MKRSHLLVLSVCAALYTLGFGVALLNINTMPRLRAVTLTMLGQVRLDLALVPDQSQGQRLSNQTSEEDEKSEIKPKTYSHKDVLACFDRLSSVRPPGESPHIAFAGDSRIRQLYKAFVRFVDSGLEPENYESQAKEHHSLEWKGNNTRVSFHWNPSPAHVIETFRTYHREKHNPEFILIGCAHSIVEIQQKPNKTLAEMEYVEKVREMEKYAGYLRPLTDSVWMVQPAINTTLAASKGYKFLTDEEVTTFNGLADSVLVNSSNIKIWSSFRQVAKTETDGIHFLTESLIIALQNIIHMVCGRHLK